jgi:Fic family protein
MQLQTLLEDLVFWEARGDALLEQSVRLHHRAVWIHPFLNGNGRWARMLANI